MNKEITCFQGRILVTKAKVALIWWGGSVQIDTDSIKKEKEREKTFNEL